MKKVDEQITLADINPHYAAFVEKFKPKKTTDDCYTPENIYEAVKEWVCKEYSVNRDHIVRPFWPGADYQQYEYTDTSVVVDNPPFSIISQIAFWYLEREIPFFLFAPYLTNLGIGSGDPRICHIIIGGSILYENGAEVGTSFVTNMDKWLIRAVPDLNSTIEAINRQNAATNKKHPPKYVYPDFVVTSSDMGYLANHETPLNISADSCFFIRALDAQRVQKKSIFGSGFLLSEKAAAEKAAAEKAAAEKWSLSPRELAVVKSLK